MMSMAMKILRGNFLCTSKTEKTTYLCTRNNYGT